MASTTASTKNNNSATKRLLHELRSNAEEPNPALLFVRPVREDELLRWEAVLKGVPGTAYEGRIAPPRNLHEQYSFIP